MDLLFCYYRLTCKSIYLIIKHRNQQAARGCLYWNCKKKQMKQQVLNKSMEQIKAEQNLLFECQEEKVQPPQGHQYGNGIRK